jgi:uncharacterized Zn-finger protein
MDCCSDCGLEIPYPYGAEVCPYCGKKFELI